MKLRFYYLVIALLISCSVGYAESPNAGTTAIGITERLLGISDVAISENGTLAIIGTTSQDSDQTVRAMLLRVDVDNGESEWHMTQQNEECRFTETLFTGDGSLVVLQRTSGDSASQWSVLHFIDGSIVSDTMLLPFGSAQPSIFSAREGYFVASGEQDMIQTNGETVTISSLELRDSRGNPSWKISLGDDAINLHGILTLMDGYLLYGSGVSLHGSNAEYAVFMKITDQGDILWRRNINGENKPTIIEAELKNDGNILGLGVEERSVLNEGKVLQARKFRVCISPDGEILWEKDQVFGEQTYSTRYLIPCVNEFLALTSDGFPDSAPALSLLDKDGELIRNLQTLNSNTQALHCLLSSDSSSYIIEWYPEDEYRLSNVKLTITKITD